MAAAWTPNGSRTLSLRAAYGTFYDNHLTSLPGVTDIVDGSAGGVRTLVTRFPATLAAWNAPGHKLSESAAGTFPSLIINIPPEFAPPYAHHATTGVTWQLPGGSSLSADFIYVRGLRQVGTLDYNPVVPSLGPNRRPGDLVIGGVPLAGTSASVLQYTGFGDTWYKGLAVSLSKRLADRYQFLVSYTLSEAEDTSTDYQTNFLPEDTGTGRDPANPTGLPIGFDPVKEKGPSLEDQTHRFVLSGMTQLPGQVFVSAIVSAGSGRPVQHAGGLRSEWRWERWGVSTRSPEACARRPAIQHRAKPGHPSGASHHRRSRESPVYPERHAECRSDLRGVQSVQSNELHRSEPGFWNRRLPGKSATSVRPVREGCSLHDRPRLRSRCSYRTASDQRHLP